MFDVNEWLDSLEGAIDKGDIAAAKAALAAEKRNEIKQATLRQDEFSRRMDANRDLTARQLKALQDKEAEQRAWWEQNQARIQRIAAIEQEYGSIDEFERVRGGVETPSGAVITNEQYNALRSELEDLRSGTSSQAQAMQQLAAGLQQQVVSMVKFTTKAVQRHAKEFNEEFDTDAFDRFIATKMQSPDPSTRRNYDSLDTAYDDFVAEKRKALDVQKREQWEKEKREEIRRELASQSGIPSVNGQEGSPLFSALTERRAANEKAQTGRSDSELADRFAAAFQNAEER